MKKNDLLTEEEIERKNTLRFRLFYILVVFDLILVAYVVYQLFTIFVK